MLKSVEQQDREMMDGLKQAFAKRGRGRQNAPPPPAIMARDPKNG